MQPRSRLSVLLASLAVAAAAPHAGAAYMNDFSTDTAGNRPTSVTIVAPSANVGDGSADLDVGVVTVGSSAIGGGNAMRIYDRSADNAQVRGAFTAPAQSGILSFNFTSGPNLFANDGNTFLRVAIGNANVNAGDSSTGNNFQRIAISSAGAGTTGSLSASNVTSSSLNDVGVGTFTENASNLIELVFNRGAAAVAYEKGTAQSVAAGTYDLYLNGQLVANDFSMRTGTTDALAVSWATGSSQKGADWIFDNVQVTAVPEPASLAAVAAAGLVLARRRRA